MLTKLFFCCVLALTAGKLRISTLWIEWIGQCTIVLEIILISKCWITSAQKKWWDIPSQQCKRSGNYEHNFEHEDILYFNGNYIWSKIVRKKQFLNCYFFLLGGGGARGEVSFGRNNLSEAKPFSGSSGSLIIITCIHNLNKFKKTKNKTKKKTLRLSLGRLFFSEMNKFSMQAQPTFT